MVLFTACSVHPLPKDFAGTSTLQIVKQVRCEAAEALRNIAVSRLMNTERHNPQILNEIKRDDLDIIQLFIDYRRRLSPETHAFFSEFAATVVAFEFEFEITNESDNSLDANFRMPFTDGTFTLGLKSGKKFTRKNTRRFVFVSTFYETYGHRYGSQKTVAGKACGSIRAQYENKVYPIVGKIGLQEVLNTFIRIEQLGYPTASATLRDDDSKTADFSETLVFTTTLSASATPKIELNPVSDRVLRLADASGTFAATRTDVHQLTTELNKGEQFNFSDLIKLSPTARIRKVRAKSAGARKRAIDSIKLRRLEQSGINISR